MMKPLFYLFILVILASDVFAQKGGSQDLGGGNSYEAEAQLTLEYTVATLSVSFEDHLKNISINIDRFKSSATKTIILSCPTLPKIKGLKERDAIWQKIKTPGNLETANRFKNQRDSISTSSSKFYDDVITRDELKLPDECKDDALKLISLNQQAEFLIILKSSSWKKMDAVQKRILMIHEALSISGHDDANYGLSSKLALIFQVTLIPPRAMTNIYHEVRLHKSWAPGDTTESRVHPWEVTDEPAKDSVDGIYQFVRINWNDKHVYWSRGQFDPRFQSDNLYFFLGTNASEYFNEDEWRRSRDCEKHLADKKPINYMVVGEIKQTIVDCGLR